MKVYVYPADTQGCGYVRLIWAANHLRATGHAVEIIPPSAETGIEGDIDERTDQIVNVRIPKDADVLVFQRVLLKYVADALPHIRRSGRAVVVDMDDDLTTVDPANPAFIAMHPVHARDPKRHWGHAGRACEAATLVTVSTPQLLQVYARHGRGRVIENCVPSGFLGLEHIDSDVIGWGGSLHSHPRDLQVVGSSIAQLTRAGHEFAVVGPGAGIRTALGLETEPHATGPVDIRDWPVMLSQTLGIGITPLADTLFNRSKSWLKPLEMMAVGVPWVASPRAEYARLHRMHPGVGMLAERPKDWLRLLRRLATDDALRADMSAAGRAAAAEHTVERAYAWRLWEAWADALKAERGATRRSPLGV